MLRVALLAFTSVVLAGAQGPGPWIAVAGLHVVAFRVLRIPRPLALYWLLIFTAISACLSASGYASWSLPLLLSSPVGVAVIAASVASPGYRGRLLRRIHAVLSLQG
ncbi:MAG: hypothetical protein VX899_11380 [Myxococcota bacterium]|nr:hypothetical protein [Myxococcota bacterium]